MLRKIFYLCLAVTGIVILLVVPRFARAQELDNQSGTEYVQAVPGDVPTFSASQKAALNRKLDGMMDELQNIQSLSAPQQWLLYGRWKMLFMQLSNRKYKNIWMERLHGIRNMQGKRTIALRRALVIFLVAANDHIKDKDVLLFLINMFEMEQDYDIQEEILRSIGAIGNPESIPFLRRVMNKKETGLPDIAAGIMLKRFPRQNSTLEYVDYCRACTDFVLKHDCLWRLQKVKDKDARQLALDSLSDESPDVRSAAVMALKPYDDSETINIIGHVLQSDEHAMVREYAILALMWIGNGQAKKYVEDFAGATRADFPLTRQQARRALGNWGKKHF